jgi:hypothetical protein
VSTHELHHCPQCGRNLPRDAFGNDRTRADGRYRICKACDKTNQSEWRAGKSAGDAGGAKATVKPKPSSNAIDPAPRHQSFPEVHAGLKDFQRDTVDYVFERLYGDGGVRRFLVADEVGLGKTLVARGLIARAIEKLQHEVERIDVVYVCSNAEIARQNIRRLNVTDDTDFALAERITLLPLRLHDLTGTPDNRRNLNFVSFTPGTSLDLKGRTGIATERALLVRLLGAVWGRRELRSKGAMNLMRSGSRLSSFAYEVKRVAGEHVEPRLVERFEADLEARGELRDRFFDLAPRFSRDRPNHVDRTERVELIGDLRRLLAQSCVTELEPDLVILDEFQRFKRLLDGDDPTAELAKQLFDHPDARVLLLSATPYKMYTLHQEAEDDHYVDFLATMRFLLDGDEEAVRSFETELSAYRRALLRAGDDGVEPAVRCKQEIEKQLRSVMVRTERLAITGDRNGMLAAARSPDSDLRPDDLRSFLEADRLSRDLGTGDVLEYWKSIPYPVNYLDDYKLGRALEAAERAGGRPEMPRVGLLPWPRIREYRTIDPQNSRLRSLFAQTVDRGMWRLLWLPPSLRYHELGPPFDNAEAAAFTKRLVFSSWAAVPRAIATLTSYAAEREMIRSHARHRRNTPAARKRVRTLLPVTIADGRLTGMPVFALLYPGVALAQLTDPLEISRQMGGMSAPPTLRAVTREAEQRVRDALATYLANAPADGPIDERWYWVAALLLDGEGATAWLWEPGTAAMWTTDPDDERVEHEAGGWAAHIEHAAAAFDTPLGRPPDDLVAVVAQIGLAAPGIAALRALARVAGPDRDLASLRPAAARIAWGFRSLFGTPEAMEMIRGLTGRRDAPPPYWRQVLDYCTDGGLQSVLDEYAHVLVESLGLLDRTKRGFASKIAETIHDAIALRTPSYAVKDLAQEGDEANRESRTMRAHFAVRFGDEKQEDGRTERAGAVRRSFNSPFWPFVLATTSVGQEGLDFHLYSHAVVHWNLPSNPVDMEQREGRVHRYKGHAVRKNVAQVYRAAAYGGAADPWQAMFDAGEAARVEGQNQLVPSWVFAIEGGALIERHVPALPFSRDAMRLAALSRSLAAYRLAFGQPRQEDLVAYLEDRVDPAMLVDLAKRLRIDLSPPVRPAAGRHADGHPRS